MGGNHGEISSFNPKRRTLSVVRGFRAVRVGTIPGLTGEEKAMQIKNKSHSWIRYLLTSRFVHMCSIACCRWKEPGLIIFFCEIHNSMERAVGSHEQRWHEAWHPPAVTYILRVYPPCNGMTTANIAVRNSKEKVVMLFVSSKSCYLRGNVDALTLPACHASQIFKNLFCNEVRNLLVFVLY